MHKIINLYTEHQNLREKPKQGKITESLANLQLSRDYREKKTSHPLFAITIITSLLNPNYCTSPFIEKIRVTNCDIPKLPLTRTLSFLHHEASRLDHLPCVSLCLGDVPPL